MKQKSTQKQKNNSKNISKDSVKTRNRVQKENSIQNQEDQEQEYIKQQIKNRSLSQIKQNLLSLQSKQSLEVTPPSLQNIPSTLNTPVVSCANHQSQQFFSDNEFKCLNHDSEFCLLQALVKDQPIYECKSNTHEQKFQCQENQQMFSGKQIDLNQVENMGELISKVEKPEFCKICNENTLQPINNGLRSLLERTYLLCKFCNQKIVKSNLIEHCNGYCQFKSQPQDYKYQETLEFFNPIIKAIQKNEQVLETLTIDQVREFLHLTQKKLKFKNSIPFIVNDTQNYSCLLPRNMDQLSIQIGNFVIIMLKVYDKKQQKKQKKVESKEQEKLDAYQKFYQIDELSQTPMTSAYSICPPSSKEDSEVFKSSFQTYPLQQEIQEEDLYNSINNNNISLPNNSVQQQQQQQQIQSQIAQQILYQQ